MRVVDKEIKEVFHNNSIGIIISKKNNKFVVNFINCDDIYMLEYKLVNY